MLKRFCMYIYRSKSDLRDHIRRVESFMEREKDGKKGEGKQQQGKTIEN